jgi:hypothetical protein
LLQFGEDIAADAEKFLQTREGLKSSASRDSNGWLIAMAGVGDARRGPFLSTTIQIIKPPAIIHCVARSAFIQTMNTTIAPITQPTSGRAEL